MGRRSVDAYADNVVLHLISKVGSRELALRLLDSEEKVVRRSFERRVHPLATAGFIAIHNGFAPESKR